MPDMPNLVSGGISLGVLAGFLSSVYYVLLAGLKWFGNLQLAVQNGDAGGTQIVERDRSSCGCRHTSAADGNTHKTVDCYGCGQTVCRRCAIRTPAGDSVCRNCNKFQEAQQQTADWFYEQLKQRFFNSGKVAAASHNTANGDDGEVRDFMESIVEGLVGDGLDNVCLRPVSNHPNYIKFCDEFHDPLALILAKFSVSLHMAITDKPISLSDSPSFIHGELKQLIKQIMREATNLPSFHVFSNGSLEKSIENEAGELEKRSYEDILATAILNKVVERHQQGLSKFGSNIQISLRDTNGNNVVGRNIRRRRRKYKLTNKPIHDSRRRDSSSDSEANDKFANSCDDCNWSGSTKSDPLSFTIEECIEEVVTRYSSEDERDTGLSKFLSTLDFKRRQRAPFPEFGMDIVDKGGSSPSSSEDEGAEGAENGGLSRRDNNIHVSMEVMSNVDSWEENWLFQKKRLKTAGMNHSMPVPMLVPNPSEECRVLIGDVDADETSDLSECSDSALEDLLDGPDNNVSSLHSESEHELENTDAEDEFLMQLYKANKPLIHNGFSLHNGSVLESADVEEDCAADQTDSKTANCSEIKSKNPVFDLNEAKNNELIVPQVDSGEGSLEIQQDSEYTEAYDSAAQLSCPVSKNVDNQTRQPDSLIVESNCNNSNEERRIESEDTTPKSTESNGIDSENHESESETFDMFSAPPRPGTIAEREHKKWLQAVPLTNNPYSKENIERRQRERMLLGRQTSNETSVEFPELTGENNASVVPIDCSGCKPNHKQYGRDYYINNTSDQKEKRRDSSNDARTDISTTHAYDACKSQVSVRVEVEVGGRWNGGGTAPAVAKSAVETRTHVSNLNNQQLLTTVSTSKSRDRQQVTTVSTWGAAADHDDDYDDDPIALPSVKELAKQFSNVETDPQPQIQAAEVQASSTPALKNKLEVQTLPVRQVHSLTARCISKEFREGLRASNRPADHMKPVEKAESCGNISDDSGTASPTPTSNQKLCNSIAFWEQINSTR